MKFACTHCGKVGDRRSGEVNRARNIGAPLYCNKTCFGLARRKGKTKAQKVEEKRLYDIEYRRKNRLLLKAKNRAYFQRTYDPAKAAVERKKNMARHVEYCRRPEYRAYKRVYDRKHRAVKFYGPFAEVSMLLQDLNHEVKGRMTNEQIKRANGTWGKRQARAAQEGDRQSRDRNRTA